ncbi:hypothetical protein ACWXVO_02495 [Mycoplasma sp. 1890]
MKEINAIKIFKKLKKSLNYFDNYKLLNDKGITTLYDLAKTLDSEIYELDLQYYKIQEIIELKKKAIRLNPLMFLSPEGIFEYESKIYYDFKIHDLINAENYESKHCSLRKITNLSELIRSLNDPLNTKFFNKKMNNLLNKIELQTKEHYDLLYAKGKEVYILWNLIFKTKIELDDNLINFILTNLEHIKINPNMLISEYIQSYISIQSGYVDIKKFEEIIKNFSIYKQYINNYLKMSDKYKIEGDLVCLIKKSFFESNELVEKVFKHKEYLKNLNDFRFQYKSLRICLEKNDLVFSENEYLHLIENYVISKEYLIQFFDLTERQIQYLSAIKNQKTVKKELYYALNDENIPESYKIIIKQILEKSNDYLTEVDGKILRANKLAVLEHIISLHKDETLSIKYLWVQYFEFLKNLDLSDNRYNYMVEGLTLHTFEANLGRMDNLILNLYRRYRFYNFSKYDFNKFFEHIKFNQMNNIIISTKYFIQKYPEIMQQYDIKNEYDLHSIIKYLKSRNIIELNCILQRMPYLQFGNITEDQQLYKYIKMWQPIKYDNFIEKYCSQLGFNFDSIRNNCYAFLQKILDKNGYLEVSNNQEISVENIEKLKMLTKEDLYTKEALIKIIKSFLTQNYAVNDFMIKKLGFNLNDNFAYKSNYKSLASFIRYVIKDFEVFTFKDVLDFLNINKRTEKTQAINASFEKVKQNLDIIRWDKSKYSYISIDYLNKTYGISKELINDFKNSALLQIKSTFFNITSLVNEGFNHKLLEFRFSAEFYNDIISKDNSIIKLNALSDIMYYKTKEKSNIDFVDFLNNIKSDFLKEIDSNEIIIDKLRDYINRKFGINYKINYLIEKVKKSNYNFNPIKLKIYK